MEFPFDVISAEEYDAAAGKLWATDRVRCAGSSIREFDTAVDEDTVREALGHLARGDGDTGT